MMTKMWGSASIRGTMIICDPGPPIPFLLCLSANVPACLPDRLGVCSEPLGISVDLSISVSLGYRNAAIRNADVDPRRLASGPLVPHSPRPRASFARCDVTSRLTRSRHALAGAPTHAPAPQRSPDRSEFPRSGPSARRSTPLQPSSPCTPSTVWPLGSACPIGVVCVCIYRRHCNHPGKHHPGSGSWPKDTELIQ